MVTYRQFVAKTLKLTFYLMLPLGMLSFLSFFKPFLFISWASLYFFMGLTLISGYYNTRSVKKSFFLNIYLITLGAKLFACIAFMGAYLYIVHPYKWVVIPFMLFFGIYKAFEIVMIIQFSKDLEEISQS